MKKMNILIAALAMTAATASHADTVRWYLSGITFDDGAHAVGWFDADADTRTFGRFAIFTSDGPSITGHDYLDGSAIASFYSSPSTTFYFRRPDNWQLRITPLSDLSDAGGTVDLNFAVDANVECNNCGSYRHIASGQLVGVTDELFGDGFDD